MNWFTGIVVYILIWWVSIFLVLPWGLKRDKDGTPHVPHLGRKALYTSILSLLIWLGLYALIQADIISFREMAARM